jgi:hypothetical protein
MSADFGRRSARWSTMRNKRSRWRPEHFRISPSTRSSIGPRTATEIPACLFPTNCSFTHLAALATNGAVAIADAHCVLACTIVLGLWVFCGQEPDGFANKQTRQGIQPPTGTCDRSALVVVQARFNNRPSSTVQGRCNVFANVLSWSCGIGDSLVVAKAEAPPVRAGLPYVFATELLIRLGEPL